MPNRYRIESIEQPTRYWNGMTWAERVEHAYVYSEGQRLDDHPLPEGGCWVLIDPEPVDAQREAFGGKKTESKTCPDCWEMVDPPFDVRLCPYHARVDELIEALERVITHQHLRYERCKIVDGFANGGGDINCARAIARAALKGSNQWIDTNS